MVNFKNLLFKYQSLISNYKLSKVIFNGWIRYHLRQVNTKQLLKLIVLQNIRRVLEIN